MWIVERWVLLNKQGKNAEAAANRQIPAPEAALRALARCIPLFGEDSL